MIRKVTFTFVIVLCILFLALAKPEPKPLSIHNIYVKITDCAFSPSGCEEICEKFIGCDGEWKLKEEGFGCWNEDFCFCDLEIRK